MDTGFKEIILLGVFSGLTTETCGLMDWCWVQFYDKNERTLWWWRTGLKWSTRSWKSPGLAALLSVIRHLHLQWSVNQAPEVPNYTTFSGTISSKDESTNSWQIDCLVSWHGLKNFWLNVLKTVKMVEAFRKNTSPLSLITLKASAEEAVNLKRELKFSLKFPCTLT